MNRSKIRYNIISLIVYISGIILLLQLFNLQIIQGQEYREQSDTRLTRETTILAVSYETKTTNSFIPRMDGWVGSFNYYCCGY